MTILDNGFELVDAFLTRGQLHPVCLELQSATLPAKAGGIRNADKKFRSIRLLSESAPLLERATAYLPGLPRLVRAILFVKSPEKNWSVSWHQDKTVAVSSRFDAPGWGPWSRKDGVLDVQPPVPVLEQMVTFRIHLDDTDEANGCLKVLPKTHRLGVIGSAAIARYAGTLDSVACSGKAGSAVVMKPHLLHASSKATHPAPRRVLHLEYSSFELPPGVEWA